MSLYQFPPAATIAPPIGASTEAKQDAQIVQETATAVATVAANTLLGAVTETAPATDTASSGLNGRLQRIAQRLTTQIPYLASIVTQLPASVGQKTMANSMPVTMASDQSSIPVTSNLITGFALETTQTANGVLTGAVTETAPATDTASSGLNGRLQRIAQRITSLIALLPASLGTKAAASSLAITWSTEDEALVGSLTETAPATDTASSGLNGRLQRVAQRLTSMIALLPTALGQGTMAQSLKVVLASDQSTIVVSATATTNLDTNLGAKADAVATTDTGTFSLIALIKKVAQNITAVGAQLPATLGIKTSALSLSVAPSSDSKFLIKPSAITTTYAENLALTTVTTITAPANAVSVMVMADDTNANNIRVKQNATASVTSGFPLQAGRDITFDGGQDLSVISDNNGAAGASVKIYFSWKIQA
jgi:hypothetical protein